MRFETFYHKKRFFFSVSLESPFTVFINSLKCLPSYTLKRKLYKLYIFFVVLLKKYCFILLPKSNDSNIQIFLNWFKTWNSKGYSSKELLYPVFIGSLVPNRNRYYVHMLNKKGEKVCFVKFSNDLKDQDLLTNEYNTLNLLTNNKKLKFFVPKPISLLRINDYVTLTVSSISKSFTLFHPERNVYPKIVIESLRGRAKKISIESVFDLSWWKSALLYKNTYPKSFEYILNVQKDYLVNIGFIHGDLGSENIYSNDKGEFCIIDWERATDKAPIIVDDIAFWLGKYHFEIKRNNTDICDKFKCSFISEDKVELVLGLLFLVSVRFDLAINIADVIFSKEEFFNYV